MLPSRPASNPPGLSIWLDRRSGRSSNPERNLSRTNGGGVNISRKSPVRGREPALAELLDGAMTVPAIVAAPRWGNERRTWMKKSDLTVKALGLAVAGVLAGSGLMVAMPASSKGD